MANEAPHSFRFRTEMEMRVERRILTGDGETKMMTGDRETKILMGDREANTLIGDR